MAIIEKHFTAVSGKENTKEVIEWMFENATEYFDTFESDITPDDYSTMTFRKGNASINFKIYPAKKPSGINMNMFPMMFL